MAKFNKIGDFLVSEKVVDAAALDRGLELQTRTGVSLGKALADLGLADEGAVAAAVARMLNIELLTELPVAPAAVKALLPVAFCRKHLVVPVSLNGKSLRLAMADPLDHATIQNVTFKCSKQVVPVVATHTSIVAMLNDPASDAVESQLAYEKLAGVTPEGQVESFDDAELVNEAELEKKTSLTPVVRLVNLILSGAAKDGASDVHIEPKETFMQVRQRVDGLLEEVFKVPKHLQDATISRLKIISGMDITDRRRSQDGRSTLEIRRQAHRPARVHAADAVRREGRHPSAEAAAGADDDGAAGLHAGQPSGAEGAADAPAGHHPRDRPDRQRQELHGLLVAQLGEVADQEHHHG